MPVHAEEASPRLGGLAIIAVVFLWNLPHRRFISQYDVRPNRLLSNI